MAEVTCRQCGKPIDTSSKFCGACGAPTPQAPAPAAPAPAAPAPAALIQKTLFEFAAPQISPGQNFGATAFEPTRPDVAALQPPPAPPQPPTPSAAPAIQRLHKATMVQFAAPPAPAPAPAPVPAPPPPEPTASAHPVPSHRGLAAKTMLGVASPDFRAIMAAPSASQGPTPPPAAPAPAPAPLPSPSVHQRPGASNTMLGVAMPGIAPTAPGSSHPPPPSRVGNTMLGVAIPGIAPTRSGVPNAPPQGSRAPRSAVPAQPLDPIVPRPAPLVEEPLPPAPARATRKGIPLAAVAGTLAAIVLVGGGLIAFLWRGAPPITARPALDTQGRETLHLECEGCADGTTVDLGAAKAEFKGHGADLLLATPLQIGENPLSLEIARPGIGRNESVSIVVPVQFRIRADMSSVGATPPVIVMRVEATPGSSVELDGKPVTLDAKGQGSYSINIADDATGPSVDVKRVDRKIPYTVRNKGADPATGVVPAAVGIAPLRLDAPGSHGVTDQAAFVVAGQTTPGATVTVNGAPAVIDPTGAFATTLPAPAPGDVPVEVTAKTTLLAARTVHVTLKRVPALDAEAKVREAASPLTYDGARDIAAHVGQDIVVEGEIVDTRTAGHQTILVVTDRRGCAAKADPNQCLARVLFGGEDARAKGERVRVFGRITRAVQAQNGRNVPEIEADFLVKPRGIFR